MPDKLDVVTVPREMIPHTSAHKLLSIANVDLGIQEARLDLGLLYPDRLRRERFERRWPEFLASDSANQVIFRREGDDTLVFLTESLIPLKSDSRPSVLMLLGNPAAHSVLSGLCFAFERATREHRFWVALREVGFLEFDSDFSRFQLSWRERNRIRKHEFYNLKYLSPFRIGIAVYFSMPSSASGSPWSGVAGLQRLFGLEALTSLAAEEQLRTGNIIEDFLRGGGGVIAFQRDAYEGLRTSDTPAYHLDLAKKGDLYGKCKFGSKITLLGAPPTRYLHSGKVRDVLARFKVRLLEGLSR